MDEYVRWMYMGIAGLSHPSLLEGSQRVYGSFHANFVLWAAEL